MVFDVIGALNGQLHLLAGLSVLVGTFVLSPGEAVKQTGAPVSADEDIAVVSAAGVALGLPDVTLISAELCSEATCGSNGLIC